MIARPALLALAAGLALTSPFRTEDPRVRQANARLHAGAADEALRLYDEAERTTGARAELDFDRAHAAFARGDLSAAADAWRRAAEAASPALASRALQNLGTALASAGDLDGAARALADALSRDPSNDDARWNLEVLLRRRAAGKAPPREPAEAVPSDRGPARAPDRADQTGTSPRPGARPDDLRPEPARDRGGERHDRLSRREAEALLDALRARERNAPFAPRGDPRARRPDAAKDW
jgi:tetratricopeptide (TPR) repeat protein